MASQGDINIPALPAKHDSFIKYAAANHDKPLTDLLQPYRDYDNELRKVFAQQPDHPVIKQPSCVPVFTGDEDKVRIRARDLEAESDKQKESFIMPLKRADRKPHGSPAIVQSLHEFKTNFNIFSESSLVDLDWKNVVVAGSAVVTSLLSVPEKHNGSKRALRAYYHEQLAPASDVDLFLYGLDEEQAKRKIEEIEQKVRDALLVETTVVRTKNAITIVSQYPTRHVQIVLRIYKSISEILTGFDVDCSCAAFDGNQIWASPRALVAYMTQINTVDLTRRSPSYENRLSKYSHRGFEVYWPNLDRSRIDPTIFERSFGRTEGLARLLILEKLPRTEDRERYNDQRRAERGRPSINRHRMHRHKVYGNVKNDYEDEVAEWVDSDEVSDYHTFTVPYGPKFHAKKIEKLLYTKDLLLNSEWNKPKDREVNLHRHPAFFGTSSDVMQDCCGYCPVPTNTEEEEIAEEERKIYISGSMTFIKDDPGRQAIGSFHPLTADDWTEMAYVGNTQILCQAIVDGDVDFVKAWLENEDNDPNIRDYTGRTPLHIAVSNSGVEVVQALVEGGARIVARLVDGKTALHLAAIRGSSEVVSLLLRKSEANQEEEDKKLHVRRQARRAVNNGTAQSGDTVTKDSQENASWSEDGSDVDMVDNDESTNVGATTENSLINIKALSISNGSACLEDANEDEPDVYDVDVLAWDEKVSALHLAIVQGHTKVVKTLVQEHGADVLLPVKLVHDHDKRPRGAILTLVLSMRLSLPRAREMTRCLIDLGASCAQADFNQCTALQHAVIAEPDMLDVLLEHDPTGVSRAINHLSVSEWSYQPQISGCLLAAIENGDSESALKLLIAGSNGEIDFDAYMKAYKSRHAPPKDSKRNKQLFESSTKQPVLLAAQLELPLLAKSLVVEHGADPNILTPESYDLLHNEWSRRHRTGQTLLDVVRQKLGELRGWEPQESSHHPPEPLRADEVYLSRFEEGTFCHWSACQQLEDAKKEYSRAWQDYVHHVKQWDKSQAGIEEKQASIHDMIEQYRQLEISLVQGGAKTFKQLHPDIEEPQNHNQHQYGYQPAKSDPFEVAIDFVHASLNDETRARYERLFEAAWAGDMQQVKELTLKTWFNNKGEEQSPLEIATCDREHRFTPFHIACMRRIFELASICINIIQAQYVPRGSDEKQRRYRLDNDQDDGMEDTYNDSNEVRIASEIVDDDFTVENIGEASMQVRSRIQPRDMINHGFNTILHSAGDLQVGSLYDSSGCTYPARPTQAARSPPKRMNTGSEKVASRSNIPLERRKHFSKPKTLLQIAIWNNDSELFHLLLNIGQQYHGRWHFNPDDSSLRPSFFEVNSDDFAYAIQLDRPQLVGELIKAAGAGLSLDGLVDKCGIKVQEKPKYYQGLSVYGTKRQDWADAGRGTVAYHSVSTQSPPLLDAARMGSLECVEWFLSDAPARCYQEFAEQYKDDKRLIKLSQTPGGFEGLVEKFLSTRSHLALHCCLLQPWTHETQNLLKYLIKAMPDSINQKNVDGISPVQICFRHGKKDAAKLLIEAGADMMSRDKMGNNLLHTHLRYLAVADDKAEADLASMIDLLDPHILPELFTQRCSDSPGSLTPLMNWLENNGNHRYSSDKAVEVLRCILRYSKGEELALISGKGDTPLHFCVMNHLTMLAEVLLEHSPNLMFRENATGRTPFEIAQDRRIAAKFNDPTSEGGGNRRVHHNNILYTGSSCFVKKAEGDDRIEKPSMWSLLKQYKQQLEDDGEAVRRLVTLNEANEVARRLAAKNAQKRQIEDGEYEDDEKWDEVQRWL